MPLMFMVSGSVHGLVERFNDERGYLFHARKYFVSLYLPYLWISYFGWAVSLLMFRGSSNPINYNMAQFSELFRIPYAGFREYWFLCTLLQIRLVHTAFEYKLRSHTLCGIFWATVFIMLTCYRESVPLWVYRFRFGMYFHIGYMLRAKKLITPDNHPGLTAGIIFAAIAQVLYFMLSVSHPLKSAAVSICMCLGIFIVFYAADIRPALLTLAGSTSMVMFIVHDYVIFALALVFKFTGIMDGLPLTASLIACTLGVLVPLAIVKLYQNVRYFGWIEYVFYPGKISGRKQSS